MNPLLFPLAGILLINIAVPLSVAQTPDGGRRDRPRIVQGELKDGDAAPDFTLHDVTGTQPVTLSKLRGKPVVLIFGSCTCPPFVATSKLDGSMNDLFTLQDRIVDDVLALLSVDRATTSKRQTTSLSARNRPLPFCFKTASAIWLRAELPVHRNSTR